MSDTRLTIYLIGFSGSGKSTIGPKLAKRLKGSFYDTDKIIETKYKQKISAIFEKQGEKKFRLFEKDVIQKISVQKEKRKVIALGGGAFENRVTRQLALNSGVVVYLSCNQKELYQRLKKVDDRPLVSSKTVKAKSIYLKDRIKNMMAKRIDNYKLAHITVSTSSSSVALVISDIMARLKNAAG